ncbi:hypothetical protein W02_02980 [Nitrospira sp. KM1]|uniref:hypothetical protein n=1 Tax=Nitrospira sp. KM1 TaxID=1936990 RepID=UPI0013A73B25|nr:hypothetical protein [Nitrospira sp. KM1]BCA53158.1 hypothetical protein W02_02980 [Nitrospira sp. KM1]
MNLNIWEAIESWTEEWKTLDGIVRKQFANLLQCSDRVLSPLSDPFNLNLEATRLFSAAREETYSDWLALILKDLASTLGAMTATRRILGVNDEKLHELSGDFEVKREQVVPHGHEGHAGRVDILIFYNSTKHVLLIEVKSTPLGEEDSGLKKKIVAILHRSRSYTLILNHSSQYF